MKTRLIFIFFFSSFFLNYAQQQEENKEQWKYEPNFMVGFDVLNLGISFFDDRQLFQGYISTRYKKDFHLVADLGYDKNEYQKNGYDAEVKGPFVKMGAFYMMAKDRENDFNGFYLGGKLAASFYQQEYFAVPVRGYAGSSSSVAFPSSNQSSYWIEGFIGGKVQLFDTNFYIDANAQPRYLAFASKQDNLQPMIISGFGRSSSKFTIGFSWNIAYRF